MAIKESGLFFLFGLISTHWTQEDACHTEDKKFRKIVSEAIAANDFNSQTSQFGDLIRKYPNQAESYFFINFA
jgi:hypothetical protein